MKTIQAIARDAAVEAAMVGGNLTGMETLIADAVAVAVLQEVERYGAKRNGAGVVARRLLAQFARKEQQS